MLAGDISRAQLQEKMFMLKLFILKYFSILALVCTYKLLSFLKDEPKTDRS